MQFLLDFWSVELVAGDDDDRKGSHDHHTLGHAGGAGRRRSLDQRGYDEPGHDDE